MRYVLLHLILIITLLASCAPGHKRYRIGVAQCSQDVWREKQNTEMRLAVFSRDDIDLLFTAAHDDDSTQIRQIDSLVRAGIDLLIVAPNTVGKLAPVLDSVYDSGIPVIIFDRKTTSTKYTAYVGTNNYEMGNEMGKYIATRLGGKGKVVEVTGLKGSSPAIDRHRGFHDALSPYPGIEVIDTLKGDWTVGSAYQAALKDIRKVAEADVVFAANDRMAKAVRDALKNNGLLRKEQMFCGIDGLPGPDGGIKLVADSVMEASYINATHGERLIALALDILQGRPYERDQELLSAIVTRDNAHLLYVQYLETSSQMEYLDDLNDKVRNTLHVLSNQRLYVLGLAIIVLLLLIACGYAYYAYVTKARYNAKLRDSYERQLQLTKELEAMTNEQLGFYTHVSHELRTPLTLIADPIERLLDDSTIKGQQRELVETTARSIAALNNLINEILDFRAAEQGGMTLRLEQFPIADALRQWTATIGDILAKKNITVRLDVTAAEGLIVTSDREKMARIYFNILQGTMRSSDAGTVFTVTLAHDGDHFTLRCHNNRIFIDEKYVSEMFQYFRYSKGMSGGLAVSIANIKAFTQLLHGSVVGQLAKEGGTEIIFTFPIDHPDSAEDNAAGDSDGSNDNAELYAQRLAAEQYSNSDIEERRNKSRVTSDGIMAGDTTRATVLVVDDNIEVRNYLRALLMKTYNVIEAANGRNGLAVARQHVPDIIISDVMMPFMDGIEYCRTLKHDTITSHIPVILLTARTLEENQAEGYASGADAYILKPFSYKVLLAQVASLLTNRQRLKVLWRDATKETVPVAQQEMSAEDRFLTRLKEVIEANMADSDLSIERIGAEIGMSRVQLYRKVKALTGTTPVDLVRRARLVRARQMLEQKTSTVSEVAYSVGFATPSYFSKCFKEEFGMLPNEV